MHCGYNIKEFSRNRFLENVILKLNNSILLCLYIWMFINNTKGSNHYYKNVGEAIEDGICMFYSGNGVNCKAP